MNKNKLAYAAGILDADGNIQIAKRLDESKRVDKYHLAIRVGMCEKEVPEWLQKHFGGSISTRYRSNPNHRTLYTWAIQHRQTIPFLTDIIPYLIVKRSQAKLALEFQLHKSKFTGGRKGFRGHPPKTPEDFIFEEESYTKMRSLKKGSHKSIAQLLNNR